MDNYIFILGSNAGTLNSEQWGKLQLTCLRLQEEIGIKINLQGFTILGDFTGTNSDNEKH